MLKKKKSAMPSIICLELEENDITIIAINVRRSEGPEKYHQARRKRQRNANSVDKGQVERSISWVLNKPIGK